MEDGSGTGGYAKEMSSGYKEAEVRISLPPSLPLSLLFLFVVLSYHFILSLIEIEI